MPLVTLKIAQRDRGSSRVFSFFATNRGFRRGAELLKSQLVYPDSVPKVWAIDVLVVNDWPPFIRPIPDNHWARDSMTEDRSNSPNRDNHLVRDSMKVDRRYSLIPDNQWVRDSRMEDHNILIPNTHWLDNKCNWKVPAS
jgi:hypothetical protein